MTEKDDIPVIDPLPNGCDDETDEDDLDIDDIEYEDIYLK